MARRIRDPERGTRILRVAASMFAERGFHSVTVEEIGSAVDATGAAIYRHFRSKEEILSSLFDQALDQYFTALAEQTDDPVADLERLVDRTLQTTVAQRELAIVWTREDRTLPPEVLRGLRRRERSYLMRWADCLARCFPAADEHEVLATARVAIGTIVSVAARGSIVSDTSPDVADVKRFVLAGCLALGAEVSVADR